ncbi:TIGR04211 family SH3 domain-containing protein [Parendozoicomonas haliclonae]|uniref:SH3 domain-containing protein n=1 Tax=Parendozoicomonas haliclonae TaxID=1960125 RepID=A0A1X7AQU4_9GAMM|nr:TIGR04211 family SH3 domain-containing protein [Parendozoicomonas haliclonae]SMA50523.1 SH3 domain-containing protein [Parendozoicomonas haliclonae]
MKRLIPLLVLLATPLMAAAKTVYIGDTLYVPMRSGPGNEYRIVNRALKTGTALTLLNQKEEGGHYKVKTSNGQEGYVPKQYLLFEPPAMLKLQKAESDSARMKAEVAALSEKLKTTQAELQEKTRALASNNKSSSALQEELNQIKDISAKSLELDKRNRELVIANEQLMSELQALQVDNQQLVDTSEHRWFLYGAGTLVFGLLIGLVAPLLRPRKKSSGWA